MFDLIFVLVFVTQLLSHFEGVSGALELLESVGFKRYEGYLVLESVNLEALETALASISEPKDEAEVCLRLCCV